MALPQYNSMQILNTGNGGNNTGRWKGFMQSNGAGATASISITTFNGEGLTFDNVKADTVYPIAFRSTYAVGCTNDQPTIRSSHNPMTFYGMN